MKNSTLKKVPFAVTVLAAFGQTSMGALNYAWGFPFLMGSMASLNTYFYRKTGTVWMGALVGAMVAGALAFNGQPWV